MHKLADISAFEALSSKNCSINNGPSYFHHRWYEKPDGSEDAAYERGRLSALLAHNRELEALDRFREECQREAWDLMHEVYDRYDGICKNIRRLEDLPKPFAYTHEVERLDDLYLKGGGNGLINISNLNPEYTKTLWKDLWGIYNKYKKQILDRWNVDYSDTKYNPVKEGLSKVLRKVIPSKKVDNSRSYYRNKVSLTNRGFGGFDLGSRGGDVRERKHLDEGIESRHLSDRKKKDNIPKKPLTLKQLHEQFPSKVTPNFGAYRKIAEAVPDTATDDSARDDWVSLAVKSGLDGLALVKEADGTTVKKMLSEVKNGERVVKIIKLNH